MKVKKIILYIFTVFLFLLLIFYFGKKDKFSEKDENNIAKNNLKENNDSNKISTEKGDIISKKNSIKENNLNKKNEIDVFGNYLNYDENKYVKTTYKSQKDFFNLLKKNSLTKLSNNSKFYFVDNVTVIKLNNIKNKNKEYLWQDNDNVYKSSSNSYRNLNYDKKLLVINKNNDTIFYSNGSYIIKYKNQIGDIQYFQNAYHVKIIKNFPDDKMMFLRAKKNSNLLEILKNLKLNSSLVSVELDLDIPSEKEI
ncbi:hypothetical protein [Silvanigrella aquatica]|uniref:Uncharacterized protein n=1 Tax=Silvanigrella aquatica TaxID=1915309 RepID=A0A1L4D2P2_9BACT|nr:hypothetical protein [Silvanigrella aquatica]APJ04462.1 hypothetical protein AXG55_11295 [Silvanigrella aquatica]